MDAVCPGCGRIVSSEHEVSAAEIESAFDGGTIQWERLPDGRYLGYETVVWIQKNAIHECPFGGEAGDREPRSPEPPSGFVVMEDDVTGVLPPGSE